MSLLAKLYIDDLEYNVLEFDFNIEQSEYDLLTQKVDFKAGILKLVIETEKEVDFLAWVLDPTISKEGVISFYKPDGIVIKQLKFSNTYCLDYKESYRQNQEFSIKIELLLSSNSINFNGVNLIKTWSI